MEDTTTTNSTTTPTDDPLLAEDFLDSLDEVHTRFVLNVPPDELSTSERIFFQLEQAWWYYEDLICDKIEEDTGSCPLPRFANLKPFSKQLFDFSPLLRDLDFHKLWKEFGEYKRKISTYGCILLNAECTHMILCKFYKSKVWTFPSGKINQNEIGVDAAAREVYEETGFDPHCRLGGLTTEWLAEGDPENKITWQRPLRDPEDLLTFVEQPSGKRRTMYVCSGVPEDFPFEPVCRKEIDVIEWVKIGDIKDYKTFAVLPFVGKLKKWIREQRKKRNKSRQKSREPSGQKSREASSGRDGSSGRDRSSKRQQRRNSSRKKDRALLVEGGLIESMGESTRWTEEEMFETNSRLQGGRIVAYDGNPHAFAERGFGIDDTTDKIDPHSFRVVGGSFMNSVHGDKLAETTKAASRYQPLAREGCGVAGLQPFFSDQGATPWGDVVDKAKSDPGEGETYDGFAEESSHPSDHGNSNSNSNVAAAAATNEKATQDLLAMLSIGQSSTTTTTTKAAKGQISQSSSSATPVAPVSGDYNYDDDDDVMMIFATDKEITAKRQRDHERQKTQQQERQQNSTKRKTPTTRDSSGNRKEARLKRKEAMLTQYEEDMAWVQNWVNNLPNPVDFKIPNVDAILTQHFGEDAVQQAAAAEAERQQRLRSNQSSGHGTVVR